nr:uncharacterized protein CFP56_24444 [Quercus suber]
MRVLISGAGVAGPTLAYFLGKAGASITILEKSPVVLAQGQNIDINGSAVTAVKKMGLMEQLRKYNTSEKGMRLIDPNGHPIAPFPLKQGSLSMTAEFEILRGDLAMILNEANAQLPNVRYLFDTTIKNVITNDDKSVQVELSNGEVQEYDLAVAADGQWSRLRTQCFAPEDIKAVDFGMYIVYFTVPRLPTDDDWCNIYQALGSRIVTTRPDPHGTTRAMFTHVPCNEAQKKCWEDALRSGREAQQELVRRTFADAGWQAQRLLDAMPSTPDFYFQAVKQIRMSRWSNSRVVCLGDAAYAPTPLTGAGASLAITGAYILAGELCKLQDARAHPAKALEAFERVFRPFVEQIQKVNPKFPARAHPQTATSRWVLQLLVRLASKVVASPLMHGRFETGEDNDQGFPLPVYPGLDGVVWK